MLNDSMIGRNETADLASVDRRDATRATVDTEVVMSWHFRPSETVRYRTVDLSETGMRIRSTTPLIEGMTGTLVSTLPEGRRLDQACMVVWCRGGSGGTDYEAGLRFF